MTKRYIYYDVNRGNYVCVGGTLSRNEKIAVNFLIKSYHKSRVYKLNIILDVIERIVNYLKLKIHNLKEDIKQLKIERRKSK